MHENRRSWVRERRRRRLPFGCSSRRCFSFFVGLVAHQGADVFQKPDWPPAVRDTLSVRGGSGTGKQSGERKTCAEMAKKPSKSQKTVEDASPLQCSCGALSTAAGDVPSCEGHEEGHRWRHRLDEHPHVARRDTWRSQISRGRHLRFDANQGLNPKKQPLHRRHVHEGVCFRRVMVDTPDLARDVRRGLVCSRRVDTISAEAPEPERHPPRQCR